MMFNGRVVIHFFVKRETIEGTRLYLVTRSINLLRLEWCTQLPAYKELKEKITLRW